MNWVTCRSCGAPVLWAVSERGRKIPLDVTPNSKGLMVLVPKEGALPEAVHFGKVVPGDVARYTSHFATCPDASRWRRA